MSPKKTRRRYRLSEEWREFTEPYVRRMPKTDLHVHLDGSLRLRTLWDLARAQGVRLGARDLRSLRKKVQVGEECRSLGDYLRAFQTILKVMQEEEALTRIAYELAEDAAAENVRYIEVRYSPLLHVQGGLRMSDSIDAVLQGLKAAEQRYPIRTGVILCGIRSMTPDRSLELAELAVAYRPDGVVAFDLAGQEKDYPAKKHREAFYRVLNENQNVTVHAGEAFDVRSIHQAVHYCGAHRIGHGTRLLEDEGLMNYVIDHRIPLEVCLTSNLQTRVVRRMRDHPFRFYLDKGLRVTINTDSRLVSNTTVTKELVLAARAFRLNHYEFRHVLLNGFRAAFLPYAAKVRAVREALLEIDSILGERFPMDDVVILQDWRQLQVKPHAASRAGGRA
ncbi:MAG: adenosine deaminase [Candidatus Eisenbacteria bacterium]|nr:adenosine deaminase [Candidatus Eisenbacteria bacterium]